MTFSWRDHESSVQFVEPRPDGVAVADDELVVHEVGDARDPARLDGQRLDRLGLRLGRRRNRDRPGVGHVVEETHRDAALHRGEERREDERAGVGLEADVVERKVERRRACERKPGDARATSAGRCPPSVSVSIPISRRPAVRGSVTRSAAALSAALYARFFAW